MNGRSKRDKGSAYGLNYTPTLSVILDPPPGVDPLETRVFPAAITRNA